MAVGTSLGQWFPDRFSHVTQKYSGADNNARNPDIDPDLQTSDKMELSTKDLMGNLESTPDPNNQVPIAAKRYFDSSDPYNTPLGNFSTNSIRTKGIVDEFGAFARSFRNAKKVTGQDDTTSVITPEPDLSQSK